MMAKNRSVASRWKGTNITMDLEKPQFILNFWTLAILFKQYDFEWQRRETVFQKNTIPNKASFSKWLYAYIPLESVVYRLKRFRDYKAGFEPLKWQNLLIKRKRESEQWSEHWYQVMTGHGSDRSQRASTRLLNFYHTQLLVQRQQYWGDLKQRKRTN